jgi:Tfp pilus assembly protein PilO
MRFLEKQQLIIVALAVAVVAGFVFFRYIPLAKETQAIRNTQRHHLEENLKVKAQAQQLPIMVSKTDRLLEKVGDFDRKIPSVREFGSLCDRIAAVMVKCGLKDHVIQPQKEVAGKEICRIPINMQCSGNLREVFSFFKSLEDFERVIRIEDLSLVGDSEGRGQIKVTANANVYYRPVGSGFPVEVR